MDLIFRTPVLKVEARLGFNFKLGLSRDTRAARTDEIRELLEHIQAINRTYGSCSSTTIRHSPGIRSEAEKTFLALGPKLWPDFDKANGAIPTWLTHSDHPQLNENHYQDLYPRQLSFSNATDRAL